MVGKSDHWRPTEITASFADWRPLRYCTSIIVPRRILEDSGLLHYSTSVLYDSGLLTTVHYSTILSPSTETCSPTAPIATQAPHHCPYRALSLAALLHVRDLREKDGTRDIPPVCYRTAPRRWPREGANDVPRNCSNL